MNLVLFSLTTTLYVIGCGLFLADLAASDSERFRPTATRFLFAALVVHTGYVAALYLGTGSPGDTLTQTLNGASWLIAAGYLATLARTRMAVLGGFVTPIALLFYLAGALGTAIAPVPPSVRSILLPVHVTVNVLGIVSVGLASSVAIAYLIQERLLRQKKIGGLFMRLPSLNQLDSLGFRLVGLGFVLLTAGIVSGVFWAVRLDPSTTTLTSTQALAVVSWFVFGLALVMRRTAGWRGRRAAIGTLIGFVLTTAVLAGYILRNGIIG